MRYWRHINKQNRPLVNSNEVDVVDMELFSIAKIFIIQVLSGEVEKYISDHIGADSSVNWQSQSILCGINLVKGSKKIV